MVDAFNINLVKQTEKGLEMLSSKKIKPEDIEIKLTKNRKVVCADDRYQLKEITEEKSVKILKEMRKNYSFWQEQMSTSGNHSSSQLSREGEKL